MEEEKAAAVPTEMEEAVEMAMVAATLEQKVVDDVLGGQDAWKNADQTEGAFAPECHCTCREGVVRRWWGVGDCA